MEYKSKTRKKKEAMALQDLGEKLIDLSDDQLKGIDMPDELYNAVISAKTIKSRSALKRQMQFIGTLMRKIDPTPVQEEVDEIERGSHKRALEFKETERWRDELIAGNSELMEEILVKYPSVDRQQLSQLVRNAVKEKKDNKPPKAYRALFRYLTEIKNTPFK
jgi:ribosome-associated protein